MNGGAHRKAFVTSLAPLKVRFEGETREHVAESLVSVSSLAVGLSVWCQLYKRTLLILGAMGGADERVTQVGAAVRTTSTTVTTTTYNIALVTLPQHLTQTGRRFRITGCANITPDTSGMFTDLAIKVGQSAVVGGVQIGGVYIDHRFATRTDGNTVYTRWIYNEAVNVANMNITLVGVPAGGGSSVNASSTRPATLTVDTVD